MYKKDAIKKAYGKYWEQVKDHVTVNGWVNTNVLSLAGDSIIYEQGKDRKGIDLDFYHRPLSISGIENNNGWNKIENEDDYPADWTLARFIPHGEFDNAFIGYIDGKTREVYFMDKKYDFDKNAWCKSQITHWMPLEDVKPPLY